MLKIHLSDIRRGNETGTGNLIPAIILVRYVTTLGLKDAKDLVEASLGKALTVDVTNVLITRDQILTLAQERGLAANLKITGANPKIDWKGQYDALVKTLKDTEEGLQNTRDDYYRLCERLDDERKEHNVLKDDASALQVKNNELVQQLMKLENQSTTVEALHEDMDCRIFTTLEIADTKIRIKGATSVVLSRILPEERS